MVASPSQVSVERRSGLVGRREEGIVRLVGRAGVLSTGIAFFFLAPLLASALGIGLQFIHIGEQKRLLMAVAAIVASTVCGFLCLAALQWFERHPEWYPHVAVASIAVWGIIGAVVGG